MTKKFCSGGKFLKFPHCDGSEYYVYLLWKNKKFAVYSVEITESLFIFTVVCMYYKLYAKLDIIRWDNICCNYIGIVCLRLSKPKNAFFHQFFTNLKELNSQSRHDIPLHYVPICYFFLLHWRKFAFEAQHIGLHSGL